jgi:hypothetical protein
MFAYDYPLLGVFWTLLWFALFFIWIWLLIVIFTDIFRSHDIGGVAKTLWVLFVVFLPFLGILFYLIFRGKGMAERQAQSQAKAQQDFRSYVQETAGGPSTSDQLAQLADLKDRGVLSEAEFQTEKAKILS